MIKSYYVKTPAVPYANFPPAGHLKSHDIRTGTQSWATLQQTYTRESIWDLIIYNFNTTVSKEVNWYMGSPQYLGCVRTTGDRKSYQFSDKASPGILYIPPPGWRSQDQLHPPAAPPPAPNVQQENQLRAAVTTVLNSAATMAVKFTWGAYGISYSGYNAIAKLIDLGKISVACDPTLKQGRAAYDSGGNSLFLSSAPASNPESDAVIIHEATHALLDLMWASKLSVIESEAIAYLAQAMYYVKRTSHHMSNSEAHKKASTIAEALLDTSHKLDDTDRTALCTAVFQSPMYKNDLFRMSGYNGIS